MTKNLRSNYLTYGRLGNRVWKKVLCGQDIIDKAKQNANDRGIVLRENISVKSAADFLANEIFDDFRIEPFYGILKADPLALYVG
jgi:hypothetical protein